MSDNVPMMGVTLAQKHFPHLRTRKALRLNNGSFGGCPTEVLEAADQQRRLWIEAPDFNWYYELEQGLSTASIKTAQLVGCASDALALVDNITVASAIVTEWLVRDTLENAVEVVGEAMRQAVVLQCSCTYNAVKKAFQAAKLKLAAANINLEIVTVDIPFPKTTHEAILDSFEKKLGELSVIYPNKSCFRLACVDHVSSNPGIVMPLKDLVDKCRKAGFNKVYVDGAHAPGMISNLNISSYGADIYAANLHKWMFAPTSVAFICCEDPSLRRLLHHPITSHNFHAEEEETINEKGLVNGFLGECRMVGTHDYAPMLAVPAALDFYQKVDSSVEGGIANRNRSLALAAGSMLCDAWGTELGTSEECIGSTFMVGLPLCFGSTAEDGLRLHKLLATPKQPDVLEVTQGQWESITVQIPIPGDSTPSSQQPSSSQRGCLFVRLSAAAYNYMEEYEILRDVILKVAEKC